MDSSSRTGLMSTSRILSPLASSSSGPEPQSGNRAKTIATRLPPEEMKAVDAAAKAAGKTCSEWLRDAAIAHLNRPVRTKKVMPDPTLLAEILALRSVLVNLLSAAVPELPKDAVQRIVTYADSIKQGKADEILRRLHDQSETT